MNVVTAFACAVFGALCDVPEAPPPVHAKPVFANPVFAELATVELETAKLPTEKPRMWDPECGIDPPADAKRIINRAHLRHPSAQTECESACQVNNECPFAWGERCATIESSTGDIGWGQFQPETAEELGIDPTDRAQAYEGVVRYMQWSIAPWSEKGRDREELVMLGIGNFNWGRGNMFADQRRNGWYRACEARKHVPDTTAKYMARVVPGYCEEE